MWNDVEKIIGILTSVGTKRGRARIGSREVSSARDLELTVQEGLPAELVEVTINRIFPQDPTFRYQVVPRATFARRLKKGERLSPVESEKLQRIARVFAMALDVWGSEEDAREFVVIQPGLKPSFSSR